MDAGEDSGSAEVKATSKGSCIENAVAGPFGWVRICSNPTSSATSWVGKSAPVSLLGVHLTISTPILKEEFPRPCWETAQANVR